MTALAKAILAAVQAEPGFWSVAALASDLDCPREEIHRALLELLAEGISVSDIRPDAPRWSHRDQRVGLARRMYREGVSVQMIAQAFRVSEDTVRDYLGEELPRNATHTNSILALLGSVPRKSLTTAEIAAHIGCTQRMVRLVVEQRKLGRYVRRSAWDVAA